MPPTEGLQAWEFDSQKMWVFYRIDALEVDGQELKRVVVIWIKERLSDYMPLPETSPLFKKARRRFMGEYSSGKLTLTPFQSPV